MLIYAYLPRMLEKQIPVQTGGWEHIEEKGELRHQTNPGDSFVLVPRPIGMGLLGLGIYWVLGKSTSSVVWRTPEYIFQPL